jgi:hypothetical protein
LIHVSTESWDANSVPHSVTSSDGEPSARELGLRHSLPGQELTALG